jgi:glucose-1-phosphate cytidylyltransferase
LADKENFGMKVVLFCGGLGTRLREYSETIPKPMVEIGYRPILWYVMKYYAYHGHKDFVLCLGYRGDIIKNYFLTYNECVSNDFTLSEGGKNIQLEHNDIQDWRITFVDTGLQSNLGQRLVAVKEHLQGEEVFLANYSDGLTDLPFSEYMEHFRNQKKIASCVCVKSAQTFHVVKTDSKSLVTDIRVVGESDLWINGGFFIFRHEIFDYIQEGEELVQEPFQRLIAKEQLIAYKYRGFFAAMDTFKEKRIFDDLYASGERPWEVWTARPNHSGKQRNA